MPYGARESMHQKGDYMNSNRLRLICIMLKRYESVILLVIKLYLIFG